jgi:hypothetical protein
MAANAFQFLPGRDKETVAMTGFYFDVEAPPRATQGNGRSDAGARGKPQVPLEASLPQGARPGALDGTLRFVQDLIEYRRAKANFGSGLEEYNSLLKRFLAASVGRKCLRLRFDADREPALGPNWLTLSLDHVEQRAKERGEVSIDIEDEYCDAVFCTGLERVSRPASLIAEVERMLKGAGQIWVQTPLCGPFRPPSGQQQPEYWRFTPWGLQMLLQDFDEILSSVYLLRASALRTWSYFYGIKPMQEEGSSPEAGTCQQTRTYQDLTAARHGETQLKGGDGSVG